MKRYRVTLICLALAAITVGLYWPMTRHDFVNIDDPRFISQNPHVRVGLTWAGVVWAFQTFYTENWQPLTWLSHMLDCQMYGLNAGGHHLTNLLLHLANSLLLFLWLNGLTQATWRSAFVAAFFAWHPLHVESVAWVCERKDVLSTFFWMLALMAYTRYAQGGTGPPNRARAALFYALTLIFFACGLMSKPMVVTLPCVLLLLDFWPLNRFGFFGEAAILNGPQSMSDHEDATPSRPHPGPLPPPREREKRFPRIGNLNSLGWSLAEKIPFLLLTVVMSVATLYAQKAGGALSAASMPLSARVANSLVNYATYLDKTFWPSGLAFFYPFTYTQPAGLVAGSALLLAVATGWCVWRVRRDPWWLFGWLWYLGTMVPTVGLVHVGIQSRADRYMYIPSVGVFIFVVWGLCRLFERWPGREKVLPALGGVALAGCLATTSIQLGYWQNSVTLSEHAIAVTTNNYVAYESLGRALYDLGQKDEALACYEKSLQIEPDFPQSQFNLGLALRERGDLAGATEHFAAAVKLVPNRYETRTALGSALLSNGKLDEAVAQFSEALRLEPDSAEAHRNVAVALARQGNITGALPQFAEAVRLEPANADLRFELGLALLDTHQPAAAAAQFAAELALTPNETKAHYRLAQALQQQNQLADAVAHYQAALRLTPNFPEAKAALDQIFAAHPELEHTGNAGR